MTLVEMSRTRPKKIEEKFNLNKVSIIMLKPDAENHLVGEHKLSEVIMGIVKSLGLRIEEVGVVDLAEKEIRTIYPVLNEPSEYGEVWKKQVIDHLKSSPITSLLVSGDEALSKSK